jgi:hypothetical protein
MQLLTLLLAAVAPVASHSPVGMYETHQMEVAAGLELKANHRFRYALSYGAVDEEGEGTWTFDGKSVRLTSNPMPKAPSFELVRDDPAPKGELYLKLEDPGFEWGHPLYALAAGESRQAFGIEADDSGRVDLSGKPAVAMIAPEMPVFGPTGDVFKLSQDRGHRLLFRFHRNDLGKARFNGETLRIVGKELLLDRYDMTFRFAKVRP